MSSSLKFPSSVITKAPTKYEVSGFKSLKISVTSVLLSNITLNSDFVNSSSFSD